MRKLVIFCRSKGWGGTEKNSLLIAQELSKKNYQVYLVSNSDHLFSIAKPNENLSLIRMNSGGDLNPVSIWKTYQLIRRLQPDCVFLTMNKDYWLGGLAAYLSGKRVVIRLGIERETKQNLKYRLIYGRFIDLVTVNSQVIKDTLLRTTPQLTESQLRVIHNGVTIKTKNSTTDSEFKMIGAAGRLTEQKGFDILLNALSQLKKSNQQFKVIIAGEGPDEVKLKSHCSELGLNDHVSFPGFLSDMNAFYSQLDLFVISSRYEGMASAATEAMAYGIPVVTTNVSGANELLDNGRLGKIVPIGSAADLAKAIDELLQSNNQNLSQEIIRHIEINYSIDSMIANYEKALFP
ncbi:MAG: glycosyltransferase [Calditrichaeota bacterium]|nr:glycosyltransferase [Calditrichota bacterium]